MEVSEMVDLLLEFVAFGIIVIALIVVAAVAFLYAINWAYLRFAVGDINGFFREMERRTGAELKRKRMGYSFAPEEEIVLKGEYHGLGFSVKKEFDGMPEIIVDFPAPIEIHFAYDPALDHTKPGSLIEKIYSLNQVPLSGRKWGVFWVHGTVDGKTEAFFKKYDRSLKMLSSKMLPMVGRYRSMISISGNRISVPVKANAKNAMEILDLIVEIVESEKRNH